MTSLCPSLRLVVFSSASRQWAFQTSARSSRCISMWTPITTTVKRGGGASTTIRLASMFPKVKQTNRTQIPMLQRFEKSTLAVIKDNDDENETNDAKNITSKTISAAPITVPPSITKGEPYLWDLGIPSMIPEWKKMMHSETFLSDISAGITVGCIAVPLSLAIAVASGVPAEVGLVTAAVSGVAGGLLGGTTLAITGPAAAISLLVVSAVEQHGLSALPLITMGCGVLQMASGVTRIGATAKLVPISVIAGFTTGVGTLILTGQLPKALGLAAPAGLNPMEALSFIGMNLPSVSPAAAALAVGTSAAMYLLPKVHPKIPSALLAVGGATVATHTLGLDVALIGTIPSGLEAFQFGWPVLPAMDTIPSLSATIFLIYAMTSAESLLSCAALEKMKKTSYKHSPDQELIGQGVANVGSAFFMGMPVTSVIARSSLNVRLNAETRLPALVQSGFVFSSVVFMSQTISMIPMPALSGMLIMTGMGMLNPAEFKHCYAVQKSDVVPFLATMGGMLSFGLAEGIGIGCLSALALNYGDGKTISPTRLQVEQLAYSSERDVSKIYSDVLQDASPLSKTVWKLKGPINFVSMLEIDTTMRQIQQQVENVDPSSSSSSSSSSGVMLDMQDVTTVEFTGVEEVANRLAELGDTPVQLLRCNENLMAGLGQCKLSPNIAVFSALKLPEAHIIDVKATVTDPASVVTKPATLS